MASIYEKKDTDLFGGVISRTSDQNQKEIQKINIDIKEYN